MLKGLSSSALLATLTIFVGHFYFVIIDPDVSPMSFTWLNGRIEKEHARKEHPDYYSNTKDSGKGEEEP